MGWPTLFGCTTLPGRPVYYLIHMRWAGQLALHNLLLYRMAGNTNCYLELQSCCSFGCLFFKSMVLFWFGKNGVWSVQWFSAWFTGLAGLVNSYEPVNAEISPSSSKILANRLPCEPNLQNILKKINIDGWILPFTVQLNKAGQPGPYGQGLWANIFTEITLINSEFIKI